MHSYCVCSQSPSVHRAFFICSLSTESSFCFWGNSSSAFPARKSELTFLPALGLGCRPVTKLHQPAIGCGCVQTRDLRSHGSQEGKRLWGGSHYICWHGRQPRCPAFGGGSCSDGGSCRWQGQVSDAEVKTARPLQ